mmetsp:Transcript_5141/g.7239  ORF Transcript_5141/g.7239 Transcript_5141/m.7239 type:complete len:81 (+) Transcript_5141:175-417(+)
MSTDASCYQVLHHSSLRWQRNKTKNLFFFPCVVVAGVFPLLYLLFMFLLLLFSSLFFTFISFFNIHFFASSLIFFLLSSY